MVTAKDIKKELKENGIDIKGVSVTIKDSMYDEIIVVKIKNKNVNKIEVEKIVNKYKHVDYDERCYEVLAGGNTFTRIEYDYDLRQEFSKIGKEYVKTLEYGIRKNLFDDWEVVICASDDDKIRFIKGYEQKCFNNWNGVEKLGEILTQNKVSFDR